ncbi:MAG TPA: G8 domain-containing protein [Candidatus Kapabacteria bacterium]|nr:G8 domain-containing protein [Candidatus Kapabacteria bacterium]
MSITPSHHFAFPNLTIARRFGWLVFGILLMLPLEVHATICTTVASGPWTAPAVWVSGIRPQSGDTAIVSTGDSVWLDSSTAPIGLLTVNGSLYFSSDTLFIQASQNPADTQITVSGTLDAGSGWFLDSGVTRPIIHCASGSLFRTSAVFPFGSPSIFDSTASPLFALDSGSTFEYYSDNLDLIDISYLLNNISGHAYQDLLLTGMDASFRANPLTIRGTLHIGFGAGMITGYTPDTITLAGDVINDNQGESGSPGQGLHGCGILSHGKETWIFDARPTGALKDTCHWIGPSQLGTVIVRPNTVLAVRFVNDTICDSLDILNDLIEEGGTCGGHLIGRVFSEFQRTLDSTNSVDSFYGLGLTIESGTNPYLGRTRVMRTSGYPPPGANLNNHPVLRYYRISPGDGPQLGNPDSISMQVHCDEWNGADPTQLHFWRSRDRGATWAYSGLSSYNPTENLFTWDTSVLGWPNGYGNFYWMLSEGYTDTPLPVELENFTASESADTVFLAWQTASETNLAGFELDRSQAGSTGPPDTELIVSYGSDDSLRARSPTGASYDYTDLPVPPGTLRYDLYEISRDGIREWLASRIPTEAEPVVSLAIGNISYSDGTLSVFLDAPATATMTIVDAIGRSVLLKDVGSGSGQISIPVILLHGAYFIEARSGGKAASGKFVVF